MSNTLNVNLDTAFLEKFLCTGNGELKPEVAKEIFNDFAERYMTCHAKRIFNTEVKKYLYDLFHRELHTDDYGSVERFGGPRELYPRYKELIRDCVNQAIVAQAEVFLDQKKFQERIRKAFDVALGKAIHQEAVSQAEKVLGEARKAMKKSLSENLGG